MGIPTILQQARKLGELTADEYLAEMGIPPCRDGREAVGDWDATAWQDHWRILREHGAAESDYSACLAEWREGFWQFEPDAEINQVPYGKPGTS